MSKKTTAFTTIDFEKSGKQIGFVDIPHSPHEDAWGRTRIPLAIIANGSGPTVILQGGNHGDEYEGPIVLGELIRDLAPEKIQGRLIILPAINTPAVSAGRRTSPVDGLNLNRTYPGDHNGTITQQISAYINDVIYPQADAFVDLHSGGSSLHIMPSAIIEPAPTPEARQRNIEAVLAFNAPLTVVVDNNGESRTASAASVRAGLVTVGTELGGGGTVSPEAVEICRQGVHNVLAHFGVLPARPVAPRNEDRRILGIPGPEGFVIAPQAGVFEPLVQAGLWVHAGQLAGRIHYLTNPGQAPTDLFFDTDGLLYGRRQPGRVEPGNCCLVVASEYTGTLQ